MKSLHKCRVLICISYSIHVLQLALDQYFIACIHGDGTSFCPAILRHVNGNGGMCSEVQKENCTRMVSNDLHMLFVAFFWLEERVCCPASSVLRIISIIYSSTWFGNCFQFGTIYTSRLK